REGALKTYTPQGCDDDFCFCQMCGKLKYRRFIEVNNLELEPDYYFPQLRIALCLECSKNFEFLRNNQSIRERYIENIKRYHIQNEGVIEIPLYEKESLRFTAKHLAEIQEILIQRTKYLK
ncbi:MAG: hypothetical protein IK060_06460, partial [Methanomicrobium sp.]|nr:hypothetical protein [Methanomicrobium sp.]